MRSAQVFNNQRLAGMLTEASPHDYIFKYEDAYFKDNDAPAISLSLPKTIQEYHSERLFPFFANMLSEGHNRRVQAAIHKLDIKDDFGFLLATAQTDTPGAITVKAIER